MLHIIRNIIDLIINFDKKKYMNANVIRRKIFIKCSRTSVVTFIQILSPTVLLCLKLKYYENVIFHKRIMTLKVSLCYREVSYIFLSDLLT